MSLTPLCYRAAEGKSVASTLGPIGQARIGLQWLLSRRGLGATSFYKVGAFFRGRGNLAYANLQHELLPSLADFQAGHVKIGQGFQYFVSQMRPYSRCWGRVRGVAVWGVVDGSILPAIPTANIKAPIIVVAG